MQILQQPISREELRSLAENTFGDMIKCVAAFLPRNLQELVSLNEYLDQFVKINR